MTAPKVTRYDIEVAIEALAKAWNRPKEWVERQTDAAVDHWGQIQPKRLSKIINQLIEKAVDPPRNVIAAVLARHKDMPYVSFEEGEEECPKCAHGWIVARCAYASGESGRVVDACGTLAYRCDCGMGRRLAYEIRMIPPLPERFVCHQGFIYYRDALPDPSIGGEERHGRQPTLIFVLGRDDDGRPSKRMVGVRRGHVELGEVLNLPERIEAPAAVAAPVGADAEPEPAELQDEIPF